MGLTADFEMPEKFMSWTVLETASRSVAPVSSYLGNSARVEAANVDFSSAANECALDGACATTVSWW